MIDLMEATRERPSASDNAHSVFNDAAVKTPAMFRLHDKASCCETGCWGEAGRGETGMGGEGGATSCLARARGWSDCTRWTGISITQGWI